MKLCSINRNKLQVKKARELEKLLSNKMIEYYNSMLKIENMLL